MIDAPQRYDRLADDEAQHVGEDVPILDMVSVVRSDAPVLFTGAPAQARKLAQQIHNLSGWRHGPFRTVQCGQPERELIADLKRVLFSEPASPWAAPEPRLSQNGTIFLSDVNRLPTAAQTLIATWLESARGAGVPRKAGCRLMASTAETLLPSVLDGSFDARVYYRLNLLHLVLPPDLPMM